MMSHGRLCQPGAPGAKRPAMADAIIVWWWVVREKIDRERERERERKERREREKEREKETCEYIYTLS